MSRVGIGYLIQAAGLASMASGLLLVPRFPAALVVLGFLAVIAGNLIRKRAVF